MSTERTGSAGAVCQRTVFVWTSEALTVTRLGSNRAGRDGTRSARVPLAIACLVVTVRRRTGDFPVDGVEPRTEKGLYLVQSIHRGGHTKSSSAMTEKAREW